MKILRVFPRRTNFTPEDGVIGYPGLFREPADEVHVSVTFTWDLDRGKALAAAWSDYYPTVKIGGPALGDPGGEFVPGRYVKAGVTITSRGCPCRCEFCFVPTREGKIRTLEIKPGNVIQDNNLLACPRPHVEAVFRMLRQEKEPAQFTGGLDARRLSSWVIEELRGTRVRSMFFAFDTWEDEKPIRKAAEKMKDFSREKKRVFVLIGKDGIDRDLERLNLAWDLGFIPFAQLYRSDGVRHDYNPRYRRLAKTWSRPAFIRAYQKERKTA